MPIGPLWADIDDDGCLVELLLPKPTAKTPINGSAAARAAFRAIEQQLTEYFERRRRHFDLAFRLNGTDFELRVWQRLLEIPYGVTSTYGALSLDLQLKNGARAVGRANGNNPIPIIVPCHRVIGSNGRLVGYGGGLPLKHKLLELESPASSLNLG